MIEALVQIKPYKLEDQEALYKAAGEDKHAIVAPAFVVWKGSDVVGYIGIVPSVLLWLDTNTTKMRDSLTVMNVYENLLRLQGHQIIALPCVESSPLFPLVPKVGYIDSGHTKLFLKAL